ncbi:MAG: hypothetical protein ACI8X5_000677 [Planctomycetota bacterium]|jgi:hypothetical protein
MKKPVAFAVFGTAGLVLFIGTYAGIALISGAPLHEVRGISMFVEPPEPTEAGKQKLELGTTGSDSIARTAEEVVEANVGLIGAYTIQNPFFEGC